MAWNPMRPKCSVLRVLDTAQTDLDTESTGDPLVLRVLEMNASGIRQARVADARMQPDAAGVFSPLFGVWHESVLAIKSYLQGLVAVAAVPPEGDQE